MTRFCRSRLASRRQTSLYVYGRQSQGICRENVGKTPSEKIGKAIDEAERSRSAIEMRKAGLTYDVIAQRLGFANRSGAFKAVERGIRSIMREPADDLRSLELERLDTIQVGLWTKARSGDVQAIDRLLRIMERRAKLLGLDAPEASTVSIDATVEMQDEQQRLIGRIAGLATRTGADGAHPGAGSDRPSGEST